MPLSARVESIVDAAHYFRSKGLTAPMASVALTLNHRRIRTQRKGRYDPNSRGVFMACSHACAELRSVGRYGDADAIADAFTDVNGGYVWDK